MPKDFRDRIQRMNEMYKLPTHDSPHLLEDTDNRLVKFKKTLLDEMVRLPTSLRHQSRWDQIKGLFTECY